MSLPVNALDSRIELRGRTGSGAMGEVYRAWDDQLDRAVAVKFQLASDDREAERLLLEARLQARVEHPNVIKVHEVGTLQERTCIVFQLVDGPTLGELAADLTIQERVELLRQAALGLHAAHLQGLVHRDVKPGNVLVETGLDGARRALLGDFGLARAEEGGLSRTGVPAGTLEYMSPEQLLGSGPVDFRSDIYALGATLYALLAGRPPFRTGSEPGAAEASSDLFRRVLEEEPEPLHRAAPGTPRELGLVAARAMEKNPAARYPTAEAFAEELGRFLRGEPVLARPPTVSDRAIKWARRNRVAARAIGAAAMAILTAAGLAAWTSRRASLDALEAARLGAEAASLESRLRMEYLSEPHDLRPTLAGIKAEVARLRPLAASGSGPASYALGKGLELLDDLDGARAAYERARALGFQTPFVSEALGISLAEIYEREWQLAQQRLGPAHRTARLAVLDKELVEPARRLLADGASGWRGDWLKATLAIMAGDYPAARKHAAEAVASDPTRYEARILEGRSWLREGQVRYWADQLDDAIVALDRAIASFAAATRGGRSDPGLLRLLAEARLKKIMSMRSRGLDPTAELDLVLAAVDGIARLDPDEPHLPALRGLALQLRGRQALQAGRSDTLATFEASEAQFAEAIRLRPGDPAPHADLAFGLYLRSILLLQGQGQAPHAVLQRGLQVSEAGLALAPRDPSQLRIRAALLEQEGETLLNEGKSAADPLREAVRLCDEAIALDPQLASAMLEVKLLALTQQAKEQWRAGLDPRETFSSAVGLGEELLKKSQGRKSTATELGIVLAELAIVRLESGEDPSPELERAGSIVAQSGDTPGRLMARAAYLAVEATYRSLVGADPSATVARGRDLVARATRNARDVGSEAEILAILALAQARGLAARGQNPLGELDAADQKAGVTAAQAPTLASVRRELAEIALERGLWLSQKRSPAVAAIQAGLAHARKAAEFDPRDAHVAILQTRLQALAGDRATARKSLDRAYVIQPLVKASRQARAAEAELGH